MKQIKRDNTTSTAEIIDKALSKTEHQEKKEDQAEKSSKRALRYVPSTEK